MRDSSYWSPQSWPRLSRRAVLRVGGTAAGGLALAACGSDTTKKPNTAATSAGGTPAGAKPPSAAGTAAASSATGAVQPKQGGTITYSTLDPALWKQADMNTALATSIWHLIGKRALTLDGNSKKLQPETVEKWEIPGDGSEYILHVAPGIKIHNKPPASGRIFTAEDLAFNIMRISGKLDPEHLALYQRATTMAGLDRAEAVDQTTVRVKMTQPTSTFLAGLTEIRNELMPKDVVLANQFDSITALAGHGPFVTKDYQEGQQLTAVRHPDYFIKGQPYADQFQVITLPDAATALSGFVSGKLDIFAPTKEQIAAVKASLPSAKYFSWPNLNWDHIRFQVEKPPFTDFRVRQAIHLALNYKEIGDGYYGSEWSYTGPLEPQHPEALTVEQIQQLPGYNPTTKDKDIASAKQLMAAAGFPDGAISFQIMPANNIQTSSYVSNAIRVQDQVKKVWPKMDAQVTLPADSATYAKLQAQGDFSTVSYTITSLPDAALELASQWHSTSGLLGSRNYGHFKNADADALIDKAIATIDYEARKNIILDFQKRYLNEWLPAIQLCEAFDRYFISPKMAGFDQITGPWWYTGYRVFDRAGVFSKT
jgi:peptide/nickel transport system substrate-binding protein